MHWMDILRFQPLVERFAAIDRELDLLDAASKGVDADGFGVFDDMETLIGEGFVLCQLYIIERKGERPGEDAYACGPRQNTRYFAEVINAAGNYRKHRGEWPADQSRWKREHRTLAVLRDAGLVEKEYVLANLLYHLTKPEPARFGSLVPRLKEWNDAVDLVSKPSVTT